MKALELLDLFLQCFNRILLFCCPRFGLSSNLLKTHRLYTPDHLIELKQFELEGNLLDRAFVTAT